MIDYTNIVVFSPKFSKAILENPLLKFVKRVLDDEIISQHSKYKNMDILVLGDEVKISGSLHQLWNGNKDNYNDFPFWAIKQIIFELSNTLGFDPKEAKILGLEYGVNISPHLPVKEIISRIICYNWRVPFEYIKDKKGVGNGKRADLSNYRIKIYDKGLQNDLGNLIRIENKTLRSIDLEGTGANTLWDLTNVAVLENLGHKLVSRFDDILLCEDIDEALLNEKQKLFYHDAKNPYYWKELPRWKRNDRIKNYLELVGQYGTQNQKDALKKQVIEKWDELEKCNVFAWFCDRLMQQNCNVFAWFEEPQINNEEVADCNVFALLKLQNVTHCLITGVDISGQKKGSKFVGENTVRKNPDLAEKLDQERRINKRKHDDISENARRAKRVRNQWSNPANNTRKSIQNLMNKGDLLLFPLGETISPQKLALIERFKSAEWEVRLSPNR
ncbi:MAG: hypothetical protein U0X91_07190 [Spirosomataceae bacterium]